MFLTWTGLRLDDQELNTSISVKSRIISSIIVALSGLVLFSDKVFPFELENTYSFPDTPTFIWALSQSISPLLLCLASKLRPYLSSYIVPVYIYFIQIYWIFNPEIQFDNSLLHIYATGAFVGYLILYRFIIYIQEINYQKRLKKTQETERFERNTIELIKSLKSKVYPKQ